MATNLLSADNVTTSATTSLALCASPRGSSGRLSAEDLDALEAEIGELAAHIHAATYRFLKLVALYHSQGAWAKRGFKSAASWLSWYTGIELGACREKVRVARRLGELPLISAALERAQVSYSKVRAMTRVANADNEADLLQVARYGTTAHVEKLVRAYRDCAPEAEAERARRQHDERYLRLSHDEHGALRISGRLSAEDGATLLAAIRAASDILREENPSLKRDAGQRQADALLRLADAALTRDNANALPGRRAADTRQIVLHVDATTLSTTAEQHQQSRSELEGGPRVSAETSRRLACDCTVIDAGTPDQRARRVVSGPLRRALHLRQPTCQFPGCEHTRFLEAHHIVHWADGGETSLDNSCHLCSYHHRFVHEGGYRVRRDETGAFVFIAPDGETLGRPPTLSLDADAVDQLLWRQEALELDHESIGRWNGERFDLDWALPVVPLEGYEKAASAATVT